MPARSSAALIAMPPRSIAVESGERARELADRRAGRRDDHRTGHGASLTDTATARCTERSTSVGTGGSRFRYWRGSVRAHADEQSRSTHPHAPSSRARPARSIGGAAAARRRSAARWCKADEQEMFAGIASEEKDPRKSIHVEEFPLPELAPDEAYVAVMASAINFNTVWTSIFEPLPTFGFLKRLGKESVLGQAPRPAVPRDRLRRVRVSCCASAPRCATGSRATRSPCTALRRRPGPVGARRLDDGDEPAHLGVRDATSAASPRSRS